MQIRFLLGPAGSGKTHRCLAEIRAALRAAPEGPPLIFLAPKQATFQLERQLLAEDGLTGYTRLHILSFERLAHSVFDWAGLPGPRMLDEEGRIMALRALLARRRDQLHLFRASARLSGFAQQLSLALRELQRHDMTPESLSGLAAKLRTAGGLALKLQDFATLLRDYLDWLKARNLQDADGLLPAAAAVLNSEFRVLSFGSEARIASLWLDGFGEMSPQELELLAAVVARCETATLAFCLDHVPREAVSWLSQWTVLRRTYELCRDRLEAIPGAVTSVELLPRVPQHSRFRESAVLRHLEEFWAEPRAYVAPGSGAKDVSESPRVVQCSNPEGEAVFAAREILRHVRGGGRYRDTAVIVRNLEGFHAVLQRVFERYEIPFFLDRREGVSHHPLAELTRNALRTVAFNWAHDDWFAALKTGLVGVDDDEIDFLENEALARGWKGPAWLQALPGIEPPSLAERVEALRGRLVPPFQKLALHIAAQQKPTGPQLAGALRELWSALDVESRLAARTESIHEAEPGTPASVHTGVWEQMNDWLENLELAFAGHALSLREWLPVLESGLANLTVGVIPPALDQVLIGAIDRSRNPDLKFVLVLGLNESVFPAPPEAGTLLTESDRAELETQNIVLGLNARRQLSRERFYAYIAFTRARHEVLLTFATHDDAGSPLNPSAFLPHLQRLFPSLAIEVDAVKRDLRESEHVCELIAPLIQFQSAHPQSQVAENLAAIPAVAEAMKQVSHFRAPSEEEHIPPNLAERLYGPVLTTSVSRLEQFAACPFRFFVHSGLRAEERDRFELNVREQGSFQHEVLALFHSQLEREKRRWRDLTPEEARKRIADLTRALAATYRDGLLNADDEARFTARVLAESLGDFVEVAVEWMRGQYQFEPAAVELPFGEPGAAPPWELDLGDGHKLALRGRIDRIDLCPASDGEAWCVVVDYKSGGKKLETVLVRNGLQLQLAAYLNALCNWPDTGARFGVGRLIPAGVFYVNLRGRYDRKNNRNDALADAADARKLAYQHTGRFDARALEWLDARPGVSAGDQFNYRRNQDGALSKNSREALEPEEFAELLDIVRGQLETMGRDIYGGNVKVDPYRRGSEKACGHCGFQSICRIDPWTHSFRALT